VWFGWPAGGAQDPAERPPEVPPAAANRPLTCADTGVTGATAMSVCVYLEGSV